ncbi:MAG: flavin reductase [Rubellimicrobium sp.]|nr:flavin reductase [Rubellimicrobium sp.]
MADSAAQVDLALAFREAFRHHPSGVAVISADAGDGPVALTVGSLISIGTAPPTVAFSLSDHSSAGARMRHAASMVVHFMRTENLALARLCATSGADRFGPGVVWDRLPGGEPFYPEVRTRFRARPLETLVLRGATLVVAELTDASLAVPDPAPEDSSMVYLDRRWHGLRPLG